MSINQADIDRLKDRTGADYTNGLHRQNFIPDLQAAARLGQGVAEAAVSVATSASTATTKAAEAAASAQAAAASVAAAGLPPTLGPAGSVLTSTGTGAVWRYDPEDDPAAQVIGVALVATGGGTGTWARVDKGGNTLSGSDYAQGGAAFNAHPVWGGMVPATLDGQLMVRVPAFYYRVAPAPTGSAQAGKTCWWISDRPLDGFVLHPAFYKDGAPVNQFWVGKYQGSDSGGTKVASVAGVMPLTNISFTDYQARCAARNTGGVTGFMLWSVYQWAALQMLAVVEMASTESQGLLGSGRVAEGGVAAVDAADVASATYRGIVGLWGNVWQYCDGIRVQASSGVLSVWDRQGNKAWVDTGTARAASGYPVSFFSHAGAAHNFRDLFLPATVTDTANLASVPDYTLSTSSAALERIAACGGTYSTGSAAGLWAVALTESDTTFYANTGGRLAKV
ncbi:hypothetical protein [Pararhodospirillum photometricum]|uniref:Uncharacterized protein n=1 Tax=Pararhodospirillum photometricum DSM 122 TaxID=1150469 RepID=H6SKE8_PARPM|nr:hypothetical protein [Pararhodospirillum photometricum]CCG08463.1 Putative uncharacterized protein [Pararhodospirillum photometricum DSM 122]